MAFQPSVILFPFFDLDLFSILFIMNVAIVSFNDCSLFAITGIVSLLNNANRFYHGEENKRFNVILLSTNETTTVNCSYDMPLTCHDTIFTYDKIPDFVIVPGIENNIAGRINNLKSVCEWINNMYSHHSTIIGSCTGNFILAQAGLLNGKTATTHWQTADLFNQLYPHITLCDEKILIDHGQILMGGGTLSFQNLMVYLVEKQMGRETAIALSKFMLLDMNKDPQSAYAVFSGQKTHGDDAILKAQKMIEDQLSQKWTIEILAPKVSISVRHFNRRFKTATGQTPAEYIRRVKVEAARHFLETSQLTFEEIVQEVGYEDSGSFRKLFTNLVGITPIQYRHKYN